MSGSATLLVLFLVGLGGSSAGSPRITTPASSVNETQPQTLRILSDSLPDGVVEQSYRIQLRARGGQEPYSWDLSTPSLPEGLLLDESSGEIKGTAISPGPYDFSVRVTDSSSPAETAMRYFTLVVAEPLLLETTSLSRAVLRFPYHMRLQARGGTLPLKWDVVGGSLPTGLYLDNLTGLLAGTPSQAGEFRFTVQVADAGGPSQAQTRTFVTKVVAPLTVDWKRPPQTEAGGIYGSMQVSNGTQEDVELTIIVLAVNEYGKAFSLGYHRFTLAKETTTRELLFGFTLPQGEYVVHADAVAEVASKGAIYRARLQEGPFQIE